MAGRDQGGGTQTGLPGPLKGPSACNLAPAQKTKLTPSWGTSLTDTKAHRAHGPRQRSHGHCQVRSSPLRSSSPHGLAMASLLEKLSRLCWAELTGAGSSGRRGDSAEKTRLQPAFHLRGSDDVIVAWLIGQDTTVLHQRPVLTQGNPLGLPPTRSGPWSQRVN